MLPYLHNRVCSVGRSPGLVGDPCIHQGMGTDFHQLPGEQGTLWSVEGTPCSVEGKVGVAPLDLGR